MKKHRCTLGTFTPREDDDVVIIMATYFSEIGKSISNLLTKDLELVDKITVTNADGAKSETCVNTSASSLTHKTTITRDIIDGIKADIVLDANARSVSTTLTANDVILNGLKVDLKTGNLTNHFRGESERPRKGELTIQDRRDGNEMRNAVGISEYGIC